MKNSTANILVGVTWACLAALAGFLIYAAFIIGSTLI